MSFLRKAKQFRRWFIKSNFEIRAIFDHGLSYAFLIFQCKLWEIRGYLTVDVHDGHWTERECKKCIGLKKLHKRYNLPTYGNKILFQNRKDI